MTGILNESEVGFDAGHGRSPGGTGRLFPDATLPSMDGGELRLDSFRPEWNLVILLLGERELPDRCAQLLDQLADLRAELEIEEARVVVISARVREDWVGRWSYPFTWRLMATPDCTTSLPRSTIPGGRKSCSV